MPVSYGSFEISDDQPLLQQLATDVMAASGGGGVGSNTGTGGAGGVGGNGAVYVISW